MSDYIDIKLTEENEKFILENWDKLSLIDLVRHITGDQKADGRNKMGHVIREFLATKGFKPKTTVYIKMGELELNDEQKEFIKNNVDKTRPLEIARILFKSEKLTPMSREFRAVNNYYKLFDKTNQLMASSNEVEYADDEYKAPISLVRLISRVNQYVANPQKIGEPLYSTDVEQLKTQDDKNLRALLRFMNVPRFSYQINQYDRKIDREIFESTFIRYTYDKPDLLQEEIDRFISLCSEIVTTSQIDRNIQKIERFINDAMDGTDDEKRMSMTMIENINGLRERLSKSQDQQKKLYAELIGSRNARLKDKLNANASILNLVEAWQNEKRRKEMIELAKLQKIAESDDINKLESMSDVISIVAGLSKDEVLFS